MPLRRLPVLLSLLLLASGCADMGGPATDTLRPAQFDVMPGWASADAGRSFAQFRRQCAATGALAPDAPLGGAGLLASRAGRPRDYAAACLAARNATVPDDAAGRRFFERWFAPYRVDDIRLGGFWEPTVAGSALETASFPVPVLARPNDLVTVRVPGDRDAVSGRASGGVVVPYPTRAAIDAGALGGRADAIAWVRDRVDLFFLQLQGAGRIVLPDGDTIRVVYAGQNGRPAASLGPILVARGAIEADDATPARIRDWLEANRREGASLIEGDPNYVFFRAITTAPDDGPPGVLGVPLAAFGSLAVDRSALPLGLPVFVPSPIRSAGRAGGLLTFAEDSGADVVGPDAADLFVGSGPQAARLAEATARSVEAFVLLPRPVAPATGSRRP